MADEQRTGAPRHRRLVGRPAAAGLVAMICAVVMAGCVGAGSPSGTPQGAGASRPPLALASLPPSAAPQPSAQASVGGGTAPCISATNPEQLCGGGPVMSPPPGAGTLPPPRRASPAPTATPVVAPTASVAPRPSPGLPTAGPLVVTVADNGTTLHLAIGQQFLLDLGSSVDWTVTVADPRIVARVIGVLVIQGAQGIYVARSAGTTLLSAVGSPPCPSGPCPLFRLGFHLAITVG
jgi:hypothetical protein